MKKVYQYRYYSPTSSNDATVGNKNTNATIEFVNGKAFENRTPILQLGIQSIPGTEFYVNGNSSPVIVGITGIYELDLQGEVEISSLRFSPVSLKKIEESQGGYLIVDIVYEED